MQNLDHHFVINEAPSLGLIKGRIVLRIALRITITIRVSSWEIKIYALSVEC